MRMKRPLRHGRAGALVGAVLTALLMACGGVGTGIGSPDSPPGSDVAARGTPLPTMSSEIDMCADQGFSHFTVHMDDSDPSLVWWEVPEPEVGRVEIFWPDAYTIRFNPEPVVLDPDGSVIFHDNEFVEDSHAVCVLGDDKFLFAPDWPTDSAK